MTGNRFAKGIEAQHRRIDRGAYDDVYVVGDVHGCRPTLEALIEELDPGDDDLVVFVGDLVRRGPDDHGVVELVRETPNFVAVRGNNEEKLIRGRRETDDLTPSDLRWLRSLPLVVSWDETLVVHGGVDPRKPLSEQTLTDLQNTESVAPDGEGRPYWWDVYDGPDRVFFGHKVLGTPLVSDAAVGLDTGCVYGGSLSAYDCAADRVVSVEAEATHKDRRPEKFLDPEDDRASVRL
jgi:serine/threonine protein phosphatase 1